MDNLNELRQNAIVRNEQIYKCEICDKEFKHKIGLKQHINVVHNIVKKHQCNICQKVFHIQGKLSSHTLCRICFPQILLIASMTSTNLG